MLPLIREDKDLTQKEIAKLLKMDQSNYSKYELGKINIPLDIIIKLADFYETSTNYLLYRTDNRKPYSKSIVKENEKH